MSAYMCFYTYKLNFLQDEYVGEGIHNHLAITTAITSSSTLAACI